jgi:translation initiation factor IF-3
MPTRDALELARSLGLDLVQVSRGTKPVVCRLLDWRAFIAARKSRHKEAAKARRAQNRGGGKMKQLRLPSLIEDHDLSVRAKKALALLDDGFSVRADVIPKNPRRSASHQLMVLEKFGRMIGPENFRLAAPLKTKDGEGRDLPRLSATYLMSSERRARRRQTGEAKASNNNDKDDNKDDEEDDEGPSEEGKSAETGASVNGKNEKKEQPTKRKKNAWDDVF